MRIAIVALLLALFGGMAHAQQKAPVKMYATDWCPCCEQELARMLKAGGH